MATKIICSCDKGDHTLDELINAVHKDCEVCAFRNPKGSVTGIIIKNNKILMLKRAEEPFKGDWDFPGGYMNEAEIPEQAIQRELFEELGITANSTLMKIDISTGYWKDKNFPIVVFFYLVNIGNQNFKLNEENSEYRWVPIKDLDIADIAWDSNKTFAMWLSKNFTFDLDEIRELIRQLDGSAKIDEQNLYKAIINGHVAKRYNTDGKLVGLGWIFSRQTLLRKQYVVEDMIVDYNYRGRGLGREILKELMEWATQCGGDTIELTTNSKRIEANNLYKSEDFRLHETNHYLYEINKNRKKN